MRETNIMKILAILGGIALGVWAVKNAATGWTLKSAVRELEKRPSKW